MPQWNLVQERWAGLDRGTRTVLTGAAIAAVIILIVAVVLSRPHYQPLFSNLSPEDAGAVVAQLDAQKVPYQLADNGHTVLVPSSEVYRQRLALAAQGLPKNGVVGFEGMQKLGLGATDLERRVAYLQGLQGELTRTILEIRGVSAARVHIVLPDQSPFAAQTKPSSAAVLVRTTPGTTLRPEEVQGIVHLVASSVEGLDPSQVTVVDDHGRVLSTASGAGDAQTSGNLKLEGQFENALQVRLQSLLDQIFGAGNAVARVTAELNFDKQHVVQDVFTAPDKNGGFARTVEELQQHFQGSGPLPPTPAGTTSNIPVYQAQSGTGGNSKYDVTQTKTSYDYNQTRTSTDVLPGAVKRLSVAVVVNRALSAQEQKSVEAVVAAAAGIDAARKDQISVVGMPFNSSLTDAIRKDLGNGKTATPGLPLPLVAAAGAGGLLLILLLVFLARRKRQGQELEARQALALAAQRASEEARRQAVPGLGNGTPPAMKRLHQMADQHPEELAQAIRLWMADEP